MLRILRLIFGGIIVLNACERLIHFQIYYQDNFLLGQGKLVLILLILTGILFALTTSRILAALTLILSGIMAQGAPMLIYGLDMVSTPYLLFYCFLNMKRENARVNSFVTALLLVQLVVMYTYNGLSKLGDDFLWRSGRMFGFLFYEVNFLHPVPPVIFSWIVIFLQLSSILLVYRPMRRSMILLLISFHVLVIVFVGLPYFQTVCMLQLLTLWNFTGKILPQES